MSKALWQKSSASAYFAEFQQYLTILVWKDQAPIIDRAMDGLKSNLKDKVACIGDCQMSLAGLIALLSPLIIAYMRGTKKGNKKSL